MKQNEVIEMLKNLIEVLEVMDSKHFEPRYENQIIALTEAIRCVEENEQLKQENTNLKYKLDYISEVSIQEKERYMKALQKCNPWLSTTGQCLICGEKTNHSDDCEYVRLTGGVG